MSKLYDIFRAHPLISTDTRKITPGSIFFALKGASFDGNRFAREALRKGAAYACVDDASLFTEPDTEDAPNSRLYRVEDVLTALQELAKEHRQALGIPILAIAGSNGKTTTKELCRCVLSQKFRVYSTEGNLNNHIGVPLTLLKMDSSTQIGIVEMGASACHEIERLVEIAAPDAGILTNVGRAHLEGFGGVEGVRRGKGELYDYLAQHSGKVFYREDDPILRDMVEERMAKGKSFLEVIAYSSHLSDGVKSHLEGDYNHFNLAAAIAIGRYFGIDDTKIRLAIEGYIPSNNRSQRMETEKNTLILDCYNANPSSMGASVENFLKEPLLNRTRKVLILGDMLELGAWSKEEHTKIIEQALQQPNVEIHLVGKEFHDALQEMALTSGQIQWHESCEELKKCIAKTPIVDAMILIKGSRGIGLEKAVCDL